MSPRCRRFSSLITWRRSSTRVMRSASCWPPALRSRGADRIRQRILRPRAKSFRSGRRSDQDEDFDRDVAIDGLSRRRPARSRGDGDIEPHLDRIAEEWSSGKNHGGMWPAKIVIAKNRAVEAGWKVVDLVLEVVGGFGVFRN